MNRRVAIVLCCVLTLSALGAVMVFSILSARASTVGVGVKYLFKHLLWIGMGIAAMFYLWRMDYRQLDRRRWLIAALAVALLIAVLIPGIGTLKNGARRWIRIGPVGFQPSECAKLATLIMAAGLLGRRREDDEDDFARKACSWIGRRLSLAGTDDAVRFARRVALPMSVVGAASLLVLLEHDFGTAALIGGVGSLLVLASGAPLWPVALAGVGGVGGLAYLVYHSPRRLERVLAFLDPWKYKEGAGYQALHSLISLGSGGLFGQGLGASRQKLFYLPEPDTDFILAILGQELGLIGTLTVIILFALFVRQGMLISERAPDRFGSLLAFGITVLIGLQALMHIAVVSASMPTKGIALPFVSSGGSSMVTNLAAVGILLSIASRSGEAERDDEVTVRETEYAGRTPRLAWTGGEDD